jgi:hypothetical protein
MLGIIVGAACAFAALKMLRRRAWHARFGYGGYNGGPASRGCGWRGGPFSERHAHGGFGYGPGLGRGGRGTRWALRALFERLDTTPGQERVILAAVDEMRENRKVLRDEMKLTRADLARAIEGGLIEDTTLDDAFARHDRLLAQLRVGFTEALKKVVEALDEPQRKELAGWIEGGFFRNVAAGGAGPGGVWA